MQSPGISLKNSSDIKEESFYKLDEVNTPNKSKEDESKLQSSIIIIVTDKV